MALEFQIILYTLLLILLVVLIVLGVKMIITLNKVDRVVDDVNNKLGRVEGLFEIVDTATDAISLVNDKLVSGIYNVFQKVFGRKKGE